MSQLRRTNRRNGRRWMTLALLALTALPAHADQFLSPGKEAIFISASNVPIPAFVMTEILSGVITKGKRKTVIDITLTWTNFPTSGTAQTGVRARVNGLAVEPKPAGFTGWVAGQSCAGPAVCTSTAKFFLDIDSAELEFPGFFVGQPLTISMEAEQDGSAGNLVYAILEARVQKK